MRLEGQYRRSNIQVKFPGRIEMAKENASFKKQLKRILKN